MPSLATRALRSLLSRFAAEDAPAPWILAFSGGPDSTALAIALARRSPRRGILLLHVDHGLDDGSAHRAELAAAIAGELDLPFRLVRRPVLDERRRSENLEAAARRVRYDALERARLECGASRILTAHHRDDQAETLLLRLAGGHGILGLESLAGIRERRGTIWRPALDLSRAELAAIVEAAGIDAIADPANRDLDRARNRIRHSVLPEITREEPAVVARLARLAAAAGRAHAALANRLAPCFGAENRVAPSDGFPPPENWLAPFDGVLSANRVAPSRGRGREGPGRGAPQAPGPPENRVAPHGERPWPAERERLEQGTGRSRDPDPRSATPPPANRMAPSQDRPAGNRLAPSNRGLPRSTGEGDRPAILVPPFLTLPVALQLFALRELERSSGVERPSSRRTLEAAAAGLADRLAPGTKPAERRCGPFVAVGGRILMAGAESGPPPAVSYTLAVPGAVAVPELGGVLSLRRGGFEPWMLRGEPGRAALRLPDPPPDTVEIRNRRPGDRLQPLGAPGMKGLKELLIDRKVPRADRDRLPLVVVAGRVAWVPGVTVDEAFRLGRVDPPEPPGTVWIAEWRTDGEPDEERSAKRNRRDARSTLRTAPAATPEEGTT